jgi:hypothetical protein
VVWRRPCCQGGRRQAESKTPFLPTNKALFSRFLSCGYSPRLLTYPPARFPMLVPLSPGSWWILGAYGVDFCSRRYVRAWSKAKGRQSSVRCMCANSSDLFVYEVRGVRCTSHNICAKGLKKAVIDRNRGACQVLVLTSFLSSRRTKVENLP